MSAWCFVVEMSILRRFRGSRASRFVRRRSRLRALIFELLRDSFYLLLETPNAISLLRRRTRSRAQPRPATLSSGAPKNVWQPNRPWAFSVRSLGDANSDSCTKTALRRLASNLRRKRDCFVPAQPSAAHADSVTLFSESEFGASMESRFETVAAWPNFISIAQKPMSHATAHAPQITAMATTLNPSRFHRKSSGP